MPLQAVDRCPARSAPAVELRQQVKLPPLRRPVDPRVVMFSINSWAWFFVVFDMLPW